VIERWLVAVRDHPDRPPPMQRMALYSLALRLDWKTGRGFASVEQIGTDADVHRATVQRALAWARSDAASLLLQTRRGHRIGAGRKVASEWQLTQRRTGETLAADPTSQNGRPNVAPMRPHQESCTSTTPKTARASAAQGQGQGQDQEKDGERASSAAPPGAAHRQVLANTPRRNARGSAA
jgi:hypothetical protein